LPHSVGRQLGKVDYFTKQQTNELLDLKKKLGFDDPRFHAENCDLCGNSAFREGYREQLPQPKAFEAAPDYPGYLQSQSALRNGSSKEHDIEELVKTITPGCRGARKRQKVSSARNARQAAGVNRPVRPNVNRDS
jgi:L-fuculose-phosphate aldolase